MELAAMAADRGVYDSEDWLTPAEAAAELRCSTQTLAGWRKSGIGPQWHRIGPARVFYRPADLRAFRAKATRGAL